ncbi:MAG TPA: L,D-transpeptidase family protein [Ilumatobacteraceae bacterium]|nr:L,D-transpeptidase family protein [Ilumatobacteraceae bacterium]
MRRAIAVLGAGAALIGVISLGQSFFKDSPSSATAASPDTGAVVAESSTTIAAVTQSGVAVDPTATTVVAAQLQAGEQDVDGDEPTGTSSGCKLDKRELRLNDSGAAVTCLQQALVTAGYLSGAPSGVYDNATFSAVNKLQKEKDLFVDGLVGRETALALGVWPDEASLVVHTPPPADGAVDLLGYPLSFVATSGPDAPPLPADSGSGKRVVYSRTGQRVWAVDKNNRVVRSWLVSGSKYNNEVPGTHEVYSRSEVSTAWNGKAFLPHMIRWLKTDIGNIGFHGIPRHVADGSRYEKDSELGTRLSGGCQRQADLDADFMWDFAQIGTKVVVL